MPAYVRFAWLSVLATAAVIVGGRLSPSPLATVLQAAGLTFILGHLVLRVRAGYRRRRPYWTRESWRRYLTVAVMPVLALGVVLGMAAAVDAKLSIVGASRSPLRFVWVGVMVTLMLFAIIVLAVAESWLTDGKPDRQFEWPRWFRRAPLPPQ